MRLTSTIFSIILLFAVFEIPAKNLKPVSADRNAEPVLTDTLECDQQFWERTYNPSRLQVIQRCISVSGIVEEASANSDGDQHMLLRLDPGQEKLLNRKNLKDKKGRLVLEIVCANSVGEKKVGTTCNGFTNPIPLPGTGDHIKVWGRYVIDTNNGWAEIHPVTKIIHL